MSFDSLLESTLFDWEEKIDDAIAEAKDYGHKDVLVELTINAWSKKYFNNYSFGFVADLFLRCYQQILPVLRKKGCKYDIVASPFKILGLDLTPPGINILPLKIYV